LPKAGYAHAQSTSSWFHGYIHFPACPARLRRRRKPGFGTKIGAGMVREVSCDRYCGASPLQMAPPFRTLHLHYNVEDLAESLAEGILVGHPSMPVFRFDPDQIANLIAYLKTLEKR
jgi:hypothetical protein